MKISINQTNTSEPVVVREMTPQEKCESQLSLITEIIKQMNRDLRKALR